MGIELTAAQALEIWRAATLEGVRRDTPDLSARQMAVLLTVYLSTAPQTVRGLAEQLKVSKPAITRALDRLGDHGLIKRKPDEHDRRSILVQRTVQGSVFLREFGDLVSSVAAEA